MAFSFPSGSVLYASDLNTYLQDSGWQAMAGSYATGWSDYGGGNEVGRYRKMGRRVDVRGMVKCADAITASTFSTIITLPDGYRPVAYTAAWSCISTSSNLVGQMTVSTAGDVQWFSPTATEAGANFVIAGTFYID